MAKAFYPTNDGYIGNLEKLSLVQLQDLVRRQQDLIKKRVFLSKLPDKGQKIKEHLEILQKELSRRGETDFNSHVHELSERTLSNGLQNEINIETCQTPVEHLEGNSEEQICGAKKEEMTSFVEIYSKESDRTTSNSAIPEQMDLENVLDRLTLNGDQSGEPEDQSCRIKHQYDIAVEKSEENMKYGLKQPLRLNRALKVEHVKDLPPEIMKLKDQIKVITQKTDFVNMHKPEESAAMPPSYKYSTAKTIALKESLELQKRQKQIQEELNAQLAAEKLSSRLNIKLESYNPEGVDMSYRRNPDIDSDDEDDDDIPSADEKDDQLMTVPSDTED